MKDRQLTVTSGVALKIRAMSSHPRMRPYGVILLVTIVLMSLANTRSHNKSVSN